MDIQELLCNGFTEQVDMFGTEECSEHIRGIANEYQTMLAILKDSQDVEVRNSLKAQFMAIIQILREDEDY